MKSQFFNSLNFPEINRPSNHRLFVRFGSQTARKTAAMREPRVRRTAEGWSVWTAEALADMSRTVVATIGGTRPGPE